MAIVTKKIDVDEIGEVKIEGRLWRAINNNGLTFEENEKVLVKAISGTKLIVSKVEEENKEVIL